MSSQSSQRTGCHDCHHAKSFHGGGSKPCRALGCHCPKWAEPKAEETKSTDPAVVG